MRIANAAAPYARIALLRRRRWCGCGPLADLVDEEGEAGREQRAHRVLRPHVEVAGELDLQEVREQPDEPGHDRHGRRLQDARDRVELERQLLDEVPDVARA